MGRDQCAGGSGPGVLPVVVQAPIPPQSTQQADEPKDAAHDAAGDRSCAAVVLSGQRSIHAITHHTTTTTVTVTITAAAITTTATTIVS